MKKLIEIGLILCFIEFVFYYQMASCKKKEAKNKCGIKVVAIERVKYKLIPVEVPRYNYLPDKQLTTKELKNAWKVFEYSGIKNSDDETDDQQDNDVIIQPLPMNQPPQAHQTTTRPMHPINTAPLVAVPMISNNQPSGNMRPQVIYQRYDTVDSDLERTNDSMKDESEDNFHGYKDSENQDNSSVRHYSSPKLKRRSALKRKVSKKMFYDYD